MSSKWNAKKLLEENEYFCSAPWVHQYVGPPGDVKPCCVYQHDKSLGSLKKDNLETIWNNEETRQLRLDLLNGVRREECGWCHVRERPFKHSFNDIYFAQRPEIQKIVEETKDDGSVDEHKLFYMDVRFNNLCNFKCRTCGTHFSTSIAAEEKQMHPDKPNIGLTYPGQTEDQVFQEMLPHLPNLVEVYFAGGEPMMQKEHYQTLEKLVEIGNTDCLVKYNTNFSKLKLGKWDVLEYWKHFNQVVVLGSIDGSYERAEYWRKGTIWSEIVENRKRMIEECPKVIFTLSGTISWVNVLNWIDLHVEWTETGLMGIDDMMVNELITPAWFCMKNVPIWKKAQIEHKIKKHIEWLEKNKAEFHTTAKFRSAINFMMSDFRKEEEFPAKDFHTLITKFDEVRNEKFFDVFTEHLDMKQYLEDKGYEFR